MAQVTTVTEVSGNASTDTDKIRQKRMTEENSRERTDLLEKSGKKQRNGMQNKFEVQRRNRKNP